MVRIARAVAPGFPHHVTQRGNRGLDVFREDADRKAYLSILDKKARLYGLGIWAYCLMDNHVHLVAVPENPHSLAQTMRDVHTLYALWFNRKYEESGHLWQGRYFSCILDEAHLWTALKYVDNNPVRAGLVEWAEDFEWSSARGHCGLRQDPTISSNLPVPDEIEDWTTWLRSDVSAGRLKDLRERTKTGRPCGDDDFIQQMEDRLGMLLRLKKRGPKPRRHLARQNQPI